jgi:hypothetical protein
MTHVASVNTFPLLSFRRGIGGYIDVKNDNFLTCSESVECILTQLIDYFRNCKDNLAIIITINICANDTTTAISAMTPNLPTDGVQTLVQCGGSSHSYTISRRIKFVKLVNMVHIIGHFLEK